jgi:hypothetical protein
MKRIITTAAVVIVLMSFVAPVSASSFKDCEADKIDGDVCLNVALGSVDKVNLKGNVFSDYITVWYGFAVGSIGIFATVMIMWGGFKWLTSRGNSGNIGEAKEIMWSAIIGLCLAFFSYTILNILNPDLVTINSPGLKGIDTSGTSIEARALAQLKERFVDANKNKRWSELAEIWENEVNDPKVLTDTQKDFWKSITSSGQAEIFHRMGGYSTQIPSALWKNLSRYSKSGNIKYLTDLGYSAPFEPTQTAIMLFMRERRIERDAVVEYGEIWY